MSDHLFQNIVSQMHESTNRTIGVLDNNGAVIACSDKSKIGELKQNVCTAFSNGINSYLFGGYTYSLIVIANKWEYIAFCEGEDITSKEIASLVAVSLSNIKALYDDKYDKSSFIKNVILDNILPSDVYVKSKELHFKVEGARVVYLLRFNDKIDVLPYDIVSSLFVDKNSDYVISVGEHDVVLVKGLEDASQEVVVKTAKEISNKISSNFFTSVLVGIGTCVQNIKDLARSYKEAQVALEVGRVFDTERNIVSYEDLGIGRLIYQLPVTLCEIFLKEVFKNGSLESLDQETLQTIQAFFENNLNVSETSRRLFVHRNTLVYRLEKIRKITGLDLREFDSAITFKVALMVKKYLQLKQNKYN